jgi:hypothetical protein
MTTDELGVWALIQNGHFEKACQKADTEYDKTKDILHLRNKVYALMQLKKYEECVILTHQLIKLRNGETDTDFIFCGIANWLLNRREQAKVLWEHAMQCLYSDSAGGLETQVFLYFASIKTADEILKKQTIERINKIFKSKKSINWPGPIAAYLVDRLSSDLLLSSISEIPVIKQRQLCQTYFVIAIKELQKGKSEEYKNNLEESIGYGSSTYLEQMYYLAKGELDIYYE